MKRVIIFGWLLISVALGILGFEAGRAATKYCGSQPNRAVCFTFLTNGELR
jgi:hypothetical protein